MGKLLIASLLLLLTGCAGQSSAFDGAWELGAMNDSGVSTATPNMLEISPSGMKEGNCTTSYYANDGRFYFSNPSVADAASCPFLSRVVVQDVSAYSLDHNHMIIDANSANGDYITIVAGRH